MAGIRDTDALTRRTSAALTLVLFWPSSAAPTSRAGDIAGG